MANKSYYPTDAQITAYQNIPGQVEQFQQIRYNESNYLFSSGMLDRDMFQMLLYQYKDDFSGRFHLHTLLQWFGHYGANPTPTQEIEWREMGKTRLPVTVNVVSAPGATVTIDDDTSQIRHRVNDVLHSNRNGGYLMRITAVTDPGGGADIQYDVVKVDGSAFVAADLVAGDILGASHNIWTEMSGQPAGRKYSPAIYKNKLGRIKGSYGYSGDARTEYVEFETPDGYDPIWCLHEGAINFMEFLQDRENMMHNGELNPDGDGYMHTKGILKTVFDDGVPGQGFTTSVSETDLQAVSTGFHQYNSNLEYLLLGGTVIRTDISNVLSPYVLDGGVFYGNFNGADGIALGLNVRQYDFNGYMLDIAPYGMFDNQDELGSIPGAYVAGSRRYTNSALVLNGGMAPKSKAWTVSANGQAQSVPYLSYVYKAAGDVDRSFVCGFRKGMTGVNHPGMRMDPMNDQSFSMAYFGGANWVSTDIDHDEVYWLSQIGMRMPLASVSHSSLFQNA